MPTYNITYKSPLKETWLWNGTSFDKLAESKNEVLYYSGKSIKREEIGSALEKCKEAVLQLFPNDKNPKIKEVEIKVSK